MDKCLYITYFKAMIRGITLLQLLDPEDKRQNNPSETSVTRCQSSP